MLCVGLGWLCLAASLEASLGSKGPRADFYKFYQCVGLPLDVNLGTERKHADLGASLLRLAFGIGNRLGLRRSDSSEVLACILRPTGTQEFETKDFYGACVLQPGEASPIAADLAFSPIGPQPLPIFSPACPRLHPFGGELKR